MSGPMGLLRQWQAARKERRIRELTARAADVAEDKQYDLLFLYERGFVRATGSGQSIITVHANIENLIRKKLRVVVKPGTYFVSSGGHQNMAITAEQTFALNPCEKHHFEFGAVCINANKPIPGPSDRFSGIARVSDNVARFLQASKNEDPLVIQAGVWTLTDNCSRDDVMNRLISKDRQGKSSHPITYDHCYRAKEILERLGISHNLSRQAPKPSPEEISALLSLSRGGLTQSKSKSSHDRLFEACAIGDREFVENLIGGWGGKTPEARAKYVNEKELSSGYVTGEDHIEGVYTTALNVASACGQLTVVRVLLEAGADVNEKDGLDHETWRSTGRRTALFHASIGGHSEVVRVLLEAGANVNEKDREGRTALMHASLHGALDVARVLLEAGADLEVKDNKGKTALGHAFNPSMAEFLRRHSGQGETPIESLISAVRGSGGSTIETDLVNALANEDADRVQALLAQIVARKDTALFAKAEKLIKKSIDEKRAAQQLPQESDETSLTELRKGMIVCQNAACGERYDLNRVTTVSDKDMMEWLTGGGAAVVGTLRGHPVLVGHSEHDTSEKDLRTLLALRLKPQSGWTCNKCQAHNAWNASYVSLRSSVAAAAPARGSAIDPDYQSLIARAITNLRENTEVARHAVYERAKAAQLAQLRGQTPKLQESEIARQRQLLEAAINKVEAGSKQRSQGKED
jgi:ankyrin repeat protein